MRKLKILLVLVFLGQLSAADLYYKVAVSSKSEIISLHKMGLEISDAKVRQNSASGSWHVNWIADNEFVTVIGTDNIQTRLIHSGFSIIESGVINSVKPQRAAGKTVPNQFGWPKTMSGWPTVYGQSTTIDDLNGDGIPEVFLNNSEGYVYMWRPSGAYVLGYPKSPYRRFVGTDPTTGDSVFTTWVSTGSRETAACGDANGDGQKEMVFGKDVGNIFGYHYHYLPPPEFPFELPLLTFSNDPAMYDVDGDGREEIIIVTYLDDYYYPNEPSTLHIYNEDGTDAHGWPQTLPVESESSPVVGDIDDDGEVEIVVGSGRNTDAGIPGQIFAFNKDGSVCTGFPFYVGLSVESTPSLADINGDKTPEILIRIKIDTVGVNGVYAINGQGEVLPGFPAVITSGGTTGAPAVADMDGDGLPEIAIGCVEAVDLGKVWVWENDATLKTGFPAPVYATWVEESVALADVSGDSLPDVICGTNGVSNDPANLWAFDYTGSVVNGFPITINELFSTLESAPSIVDIDGDGDMEVFTASHEGTVYCFDTDGKPSKTDDWPMYKYNAARTGNKNPLPTGIQTENTPTAKSFQLFPAYPNPFNPVTTIEYRLPKGEHITLEIFSSLGEKINTLVNKKQSAGEHQIQWDGRNAEGELVSSGVYFYRLSAGKVVKTRKLILMK